MESELVVINSEFAYANLEDRVNFLEQKNRDLEDSIRYASKLQLAMLPNEMLYKGAFSDAFVLFLPKDIVSGDFYWFAQYGDEVYFAVGDCTGHGIPGALLNIAGNTLLKQIIRIDGLNDPAEIIGRLDDELVGLFNDYNTKGALSDGMDIALCRFNLKTMAGSFCGAGRPMLLVRNGDLVEFRKCNSTVGYTGDDSKQFETQSFELRKGDKFYLFTDGYTDQFGGENVKKFNRKRFRTLIQSLSEYPMVKQEKELYLSYLNWKGSQDQIDDVCVIGIEI